MNKLSKRFSVEDINNLKSGDVLNIKQTQSILLDMLNNLHDFCVEHSIKYSLAYGTLLGAVRHKGFIPWDDDVDVWMPRPDYERFIKFFQVSSRYQIVSVHNDHGYYYPYAHAALVDTKTIMVEHGARRPSGKGQFLDIFPIDGVVDNSKIFKKESFKLTLVNYVKGLQSISLTDFHISNFKDIIKWCCSILCTPFDELKIVKWMDKTVKRYPYDKYDNCAMLVLEKEERSRQFPKKFFDSLILTPFENFQFYIFSDYDTLLKMEYGDYMKLPPENERIGKHGIDLYYRKL